MLFRASSSKIYRRQTFYFSYRSQHMFIFYLFFGRYVKFAFYSYELNFKCRTCRSKAFLSLALVQRYCSSKPLLKYLSTTQADTILRNHIKLMFYGTVRKQCCMNKLPVHYLLYIRNFCMSSCIKHFFFFCKIRQLFYTHLKKLTLIHTWVLLFEFVSKQKFDICTPLVFLSLSL